MTVNEFEDLQKTNINVHWTLCELHKTAKNIAAILADNYPKYVEINKVEEHTNWKGLPTVEIYFVLNKKDLAVLQIYHEETCLNKYELIGYEESPKDGYPEFEIYNGTIPQDLFDAFTTHLSQLTKKKLKRIK